MIHFKYLKEENNMWNIGELKERGREAFKANYWPCVGVALLMTVFAGGSGLSSRAQSSTTDIQHSVENVPPEVVVAAFVGFLAALGIALLIKIFLANPIELGGCTFFKKNLEEGPAPFSTIKAGFQNYGHTFVTLFLRDLFLVLWFLLFLIPGFIKAYSYCMVPYILAEHPEMSATEIITRSREMMDGNKWNTFKLDLSFIGWILLGIVTLGLGFVFWTSPYMNSTHAALYLKLKEEQGLV